MTLSLDAFGPSAGGEKNRFGKFDSNFLNFLKVFFGNIPYHPIVVQSIGQLYRRSPFVSVCRKLLFVFFVIFEIISIVKKPCHEQEFLF